VPKARNLHKGAEEIVTQMKEEMDAYAARFGTFSDGFWRAEFLKQPSITTSCASSNIGTSMVMKSS
jgi:predicted oxidoreductase (fatty acid repression mutant protein)